SDIVLTNRSTIPVALPFILGFCVAQASFGTPLRRRKIRNGRLYMHSSLTRIAAVLIASTMLAGVAQAETVRWARSSDALTLDPHSQNQGVTHTFAHHIYETLLDRNVAGELQPRLATEWYVKEGDPTAWVFKLREGVKFPDGADLTAED